MKQTDPDAVKAESLEMIQRIITVAARQGFISKEERDEVWDALNRAVDAAVAEARREFHETVLAEADKHPGCCHHVSDAILARDKEPRDAER